MNYALFPLAAFAGFAAMCASTARHAAQIFGHDIAHRTALMLRIGATVLLGTAWAACVGCWGVAMGTMAWICVLPIAAILVVVCLTYSPRRMLRTASVGALAISAVLAFATFIA